MIYDDDCIDIDQNVVIEPQWYDINDSIMESFNHFSSSVAFEFKIKQEVIMLGPCYYDCEKS